MKPYDTSPSRGFSTETLERQQEYWKSSVGDTWEGRVDATILAKTLYYAAVEAAMTDCTALAVLDYHC